LEISGGSLKIKIKYFYQLKNHKLGYQNKMCIEFPTYKC